jgi:hypothetical protein
VSVASTDALPVTIDTPLSVAQNTTVMNVDGRSYMTADNGTSSDLVETTFAEPRVAAWCSPATSGT